MARVKAAEESRRQVVECFLTRRSRSSVDGSVYTDGNTLCVGHHHVAFWHQGIIYMVYLDYSDSLVKTIQAMVRLWSHGHKVAEMGVNDGRGSD